MSGICGWLDNMQGSWRDTLRGMLAPLTRFDQSEPLLAGGEGFGLAAAGPPSTAIVSEQGRLVIGLVGHPLWDGASLSGASAAVAQRLADAYSTQGEHALRRLGGDFALVLLHPEAGRALLAVDRIGIRNLVYALRGNTLIFGTTCDAVCAHPLSRATVDPQAIYNYVYFHMVPGPGTIYREQQRILPGHYVSFENGTLRTAPYWEMQFDETPPERPFSALQDEFLQSLRRGVSAFTVPEGCGAFLSGGTDSSTVSGLLGQVQGKPAETYSIGFAAEGYDELGYARLAARHFHTNHHEYYVTPPDVVDAIPRVAEIYDQPFGNASAVPTYYCARMARADGAVRMLAGDGGDELYGGNARYAKQAQFAVYDRVPGWLRRGVLEPTMQRLPQGRGPVLLRKAKSYVAQASMPMPARYESYNLLERMGAETVFTSEFLACVDRQAPQALIACSYNGTHAGNWLNRLLAVDLKFTLADNDLPKVTRMCELAGIDIAFPLLHESVVDFSAALAPDQKLRGTKLRYFFKEALREFLPGEIIKKEKHGFGLPVGPWLCSHEPLHVLARDTLASLKRRQILNSDFLDSLFARYLSEHPGYYGPMIWILMMLELWFQRSATSGAVHVS